MMLSDKLKKTGADTASNAANVPSKLLLKLMIYCSKYSNRPEDCSEIIFGLNQNKEIYKRHFYRLFGVDKNA